MNTTDAQPVTAQQVPMPDEVGFRILRPSMLAACENDHRATFILDFLIQWYEWKRTKEWLTLKRTGAPTEKDLILYFANDEIQVGILNLFGKDAVNAGLNHLEELGFITITCNPKKHFGYDRKKHFIIHAPAINAALKRVTDGPLTLPQQAALDRMAA